MTMASISTTSAKQRPPLAPKASPQSKQRSPVSSIHSEWEKAGLEGRKEWDVDKQRRKIQDFLSAVLNESTCLNLRGEPLQCTCLRNAAATLTEDETEFLVETLCGFAYMKKEQQQQWVCQWISHAQSTLTWIKGHLGGAATKEATTLLYTMPGTVHHRICRNAIARLVDYNQRSWKTCENFVEKKLTPRHGLAGKPSNNHDPAQDELLHDFFEEMKSLADVRATKLVRIELAKDVFKYELKGDDATDIEAESDDADFLTTKDKSKPKEEEIIELPSCTSKRALYFRLAEDCGYDIKLDAIGRRLGTLDECKIPDQRTYKPLPSWGKFEAFWKANYNHIIIARPSNDICGDCFVFANRHKYYSERTKKRKRGNEDVDEGRRRKLLQ